MYALCFNSSFQFLPYIEVFGPFMLDIVTHELYQTLFNILRKSHLFITFSPFLSSLVQSRLLMKYFSSVLFCCFKKLFLSYFPCNLELRSLLFKSWFTLVSTQFQQYIEFWSSRILFFLSTYCCTNLSLQIVPLTDL